MRYTGGKHRQGPKIAEYVMKVWRPSMPYYEPFCGALGAAIRVIDRMLETGTGEPEIWLSDRNGAVVNMWNAVLDGWVPPDAVTEEEYRAIKSVRDPNDPMTGFCGTNLSFGARWFDTYARSRGKSVNFAASGKKGVLRKAAIIRKARVTIEARNYLDVNPEGAIIYLDPPYVGRIRAHASSIDHEEFWAYAEKLLENNVVLVTEFNAPESWVRIYSWGNTTSIRLWPNSDKVANNTNESIFVHESQLHLWGPQ